MDPRKIFKRHITKQFSVFVAVGIISTILNYSVFLFFLALLKFDYLLSAGIGFMSGVGFGFAFNKKYTFQSDKNISKTIFQYFAIYLFSLTFNLLSLRLLVEVGGFNPAISNMVLIPPIVLINFLGTKILVFKNLKW